MVMGSRRVLRQHAIVRLPRTRAGAVRLRVYLCDKQGFHFFVPRPFRFSLPHPPTVNSATTHQTKSRDVFRWVGHELHGESGTWGRFHPTRRRGEGRPGLPLELVRENASQVYRYLEVCYGRAGARTDQPVVKPNTSIMPSTLLHTSLPHYPCYRETVSQDGRTCPAPGTVWRRGRSCFVVRGLAGRFCFCFCWVP